MKSKNIIKGGKDYFDKLHQAYNFSIPENKVVQFISNTGDHNLDNIHWGEKAAIYIGKMSINDEGIYNNNTVQGLLKFAFMRNRPGEKIRIILGPGLHESLAGDNKEEIMPYEMQKRHILRLAKDAGINQNILHIENLSDSHSTLFQKLGEKGIENLTPSVSLPKENVTSLQLAEYFYGLAEKYPTIKQKFFSATPQSIQENFSHNMGLQYYSLIEVACRLKDLSEGITLQGGMIRQKKYDELMKWIVNAPENEYPEIKALRSWSARTQCPELAKWYFKNDTYEELVEKEIKHKQVKNGMKRSIATTAIVLASALSGVGGTAWFINNKEKKEAEKKEMEMLQQELKYEKLGVGFHYNIDYKTYDTPEEKAELVKSTTNTIYYYLIRRYDVDPSYEAEIKALIQDDLVLASEDTTEPLPINRVNFDMDQRSYFVYGFLNGFINKHKYALTKMGVDINAYSKMMKHKKLFENVLIMNDTFTLEDKLVKRNGGNIALDRFGATTVEELGSFTSKNLDREYEVIRVVVEKSGYVQQYYNEFIVAKNAYDPDGVYSTELAKEVADEVLPLWNKRKEQ